MKQIQRIIRLMLCVWLSSCTVIVEHRDNIRADDSASSGADITGTGLSQDVVADSATMTGAVETNSDSATDTVSDAVTGTDTVSDAVTGTEINIAADTGRDTASDTSVVDTEDNDVDIQDTGGLTETLSSDCTGLPDFTPCSVVTAPDDRKYDICIKEVCQSPGCGTVDCNVPGPYFPLADTGQRTCYDTTSALVACPVSDDDDFYGQDAQYGWDVDHGIDERYTLMLGSESEPVVQDTVTGLMWQGCTMGLTGDDCEFGTASGTMPWTEAVKRCDALTWGGHNDWRLPDELALQSIVNLGSDDTGAFPMMARGAYWSSSVSSETTAIYVNLPGGGMNSHRKDASEYALALCVRGGQVIPTNQLVRFNREFFPSDYPVVKDNFTGLMWQGCSAGQIHDECSGSAAAMTWKTALAYCEKLILAGHDDWRLPNRVELRTIVDNTRMQPATYVDAFPKTMNSGYWTSSSDVNNAASAWYVDFYTGPVYNPGKVEDDIHSYHVRCVRNGS